MAALLASNIPGLPAPRRGKVRDIYDLGESLLIVTSDRISAFDVVMANGIPDKGRILNRMSAFWFDHFADLCPSHVLTVNDPEIQARFSGMDNNYLDRCLLARKAKVIPVECVARGYITGSIFKNYEAGQVADLGLQMAEGLLNGSALPEPIFTPATKAEHGHDENIPYRQVVDLVGTETAAWLQETTLQLYRRAAAYAAERGILLADTKFEFGETEDGLVWIDEALTPDSSRFWDAATWKPGQDQPSFDKQYVRNYLETLDWNKRAPGPLLPPLVVDNTRLKYLEAYEKLIGPWRGSAPLSP